MNNNSKKSSLLIFLYLLIVLLVWLSFGLLPAPKKVKLEKQSSVVDLTALSFDDTVYYYFDNTWEHYPEVLLTPDDFITSNILTPSEMTPQDFRTVQYASHRVRFRLPQGATYSLTMRSTDYAMRLFVDDEELILVGNPSDTAEDNIPGISQVTCTFRPTNEITTILAQSSNWVHNEGAYAPNLVIGTAPAINSYERHNLLMTLLVTSSLLTGFLYHLGLFILNRRHSTTLIFALCCLLLAFMSSNVYALFLPNFNWYTAFQLEYIIHFLTFALLTFLLERMFPRLLLRVITRLYYILVGLYILTTFIFPTQIYSSLLAGFEVASALMIVYIMVRLTMQLRERSAQNALAFAGTLLVCLFAINDLLYTNYLPNLRQFGGQIFTTPIGMVFFMFCYAMVISITYAETEAAMQKAIAAERELATDNAALDRLIRLKSDLMETISHETRTPLAVMSGYTELIAMEMRKKGVDLQTAKDLDQVSDEIQRIAEIMREMQNFSKEKEKTSEKSLSQISDIIRQCARMYEPILMRQGVKLTVSLADSLPPVFVNSSEITQVIFNLLQNAKNHTEKGGVSISVKLISDAVEVAVSDTGAGIPAKLLPYVFERGVSDDEKHSGIGLAICKEIIDAHGGKITVESASGKGTTVTFTIPLSQEGNCHA